MTASSTSSCQPNGIQSRRTPLPLLPVVATLLILLSVAVQAQTAVSETRLVTEVEALTEMPESSTEFPPGDALDWKPMTLPIAGRFGSEDLSDRVLWLRFALQKPTTGEPSSLYFYRYNLSMDAYFNGQRIGGDSYRENRQTVAWNHPRIVDIQDANWLEGENIVHIRFVGSYFGGTFGPVLFGPQSTLQALYEERFFRQIKINEWLQASGILITFLALTLWIMRRNDPIYILFAALTSAWLVVQTHMVVYYNLIEYRFWLPIVHCAIDLFILFMFLFLTRFARLPSPRAERVLIAWTVFALLWHAFAPLAFWWMGAYVVHLFGNLFMLPILARLALRAIRERDTLSIVIGLTVVVQLALGIHDWLLIMTGNSEDWESAMYLSQFAFPLLLLVFMVGLLNRFVSALNTAEELNRDLEAKVEASRRMIEASYAERRALEIGKAAEQERVKIYRDLHDDVGSKLLSIVHAGRDHKLGELARTALRSLREAVSRANSPQQSLPDFLAALREECLLRLEGTGHHVEWHEQSDLPTIALSSEQVYNLNQISREIVSNIIRHAGAKKISIAVSINDASNNWQLSFQDDGIGLDESIPGNGLRHIRERAENINGAVNWESTVGGGLNTTLTIPITAVSIRRELPGN